MFGSAACRTTDEIGSPNQFDYVNPRYVSSQISFSKSMQVLWRSIPWEYKAGIPKFPLL